MKSLAKKRILATIMIMTLITFFAMPLTAYADTQVKLHLAKNMPDVTSMTVHAGDPNKDFTLNKSNGFDAPDDAWDILPTMKSIDIIFVGSVSVFSYSPKTDIGNQGHQLAEPIEYSKEGNGTINFWINSYPGVEPEPEPDISIVKSVSPSAVTTTDGSVQYTFVVENTVEVDLSGVVVSDDAINARIDIGSLEVDETTTASITFNLGKLGTAGYGNWVEGVFLNTATVTGYNGTVPVTDDDFATVTYDETPVLVPDISIVKSVSPSAVTTTNGSVQYTFVVENTGEADLSNVKISDDAINARIDIGNLEVDETTTASITFDLSRLGTAGYGRWVDGEFKNIAEVSGSYTGASPVSATDDAIVVYDPIFVPDPELDIEKKVRLAAPETRFSDELEVGDDSINVFYQFTVYNTGNVDLEDVHVYDQLIGWTSESAYLTAGAFTVFTYGPYPISGDAWGDDNRVVNIASAAGFYGRVPVTSPTDSAIVDYDGEPNEESIDLQKSVSPGTVHSRSADVTYKFVVKNDGDTPLYNVYLEDDDINFEWPIGNLAVGATTSASVEFDLGNLGDDGYGDWEGKVFTNEATVYGYLRDYRGEFPRPDVSDSDEATVRYSSSGGDGGGTTIIDEPIPNAPVVDEPVIEEPIPAAPLPKTGGIPALLLYGLGTLLAGGGTALKLKNRK